MYIPNLETIGLEQEDISVGAISIQPLSKSAPSKYSGFSFLVCSFLGLKEKSVTSKR